MLTGERVSRQYDCLFTETVSSMNNEIILDKNMQDSPRSLNSTKLVVTNLSQSIPFSCRLVRKPDQFQGQSTRTAEKNSQDHVRRSSEAFFETKFVFIFFEFRYFMSFWGTEYYVPKISELIHKRWPDLFELKAERHTSSRVAKVRVWLPFPESVFHPITPY